jgi:hypothetical protein
MQSFIGAFARARPFPLAQNGGVIRGVYQTTRLNMAQTLLNDTTVEAIRDRYRTLFANAFAPNVRFGQMPGADERVAYAAEFAAYRLGQIDEKLGRLVEIMERGSNQYS